MADDMGQTNQCLEVKESSYLGGNTVTGRGHQRDFRGAGHGLHLDLGASYTHVFSLLMIL